MLASKIAVFSFYILDKIDLHINNGSSPSKTDWIFIKVPLLIYHILYINGEDYHIWNIVHCRQ